jgi:hypothetical protein
MKRLLMTLFLGVMTAAPAFGQTPKPADTPKPAEAQKTEPKPAETKPAESLPTADQIMEKYVQAIGGKAAIEKASSRVTKGVFEIPAMGASGPIEMYAKAPNKSAMTITFPGFGTIQQGYNGQIGWAQEPTSGLRELSGAELASAQRDAEFYGPLKMKELYPKMAVTGKTKVGSGESFIVEMTPAVGKTEKWYFDTQTGLLTRIDVEVESPQGSIPFEVYLEDYRDVEGTKMPFTVRRTSPAISFTIRLEEVKNNVPVDDAKFNKPAGQ